MERRLGGSGNGLTAVPAAREALAAAEVESCGSSTSSREEGNGRSEEREDLARIHRRDREPSKTLFVPGHYVVHSDFERGSGLDSVFEIVNWEDQSLVEVGFLYWYDFQEAKEIGDSRCCRLSVPCPRHYIVNRGESVAGHEPVCLSSFDSREEVSC